MSDLGRCKHTLYILKHKPEYTKGWGWRCRYCGRTYKDLREEAEVFILCTIAVVGLSVVDTLWFNAMPESNRYKNVQAFNVVTLWIVAIVLIIKLVTM